MASGLRPILDAVPADEDVENNSEDEDVEKDFYDSCIDREDEEHGDNEFVDDHLQQEAPV